MDLDEHSEAAAILMDVSQSREGLVLSASTQGDAILMNVAQSQPVAMETNIQPSETITLANAEPETVFMAAATNSLSDGESNYIVLNTPIENIKTEVVDESYAVAGSDGTTIAPKQFQMKSSDGQFHTITLMGVEERVGEGGDMQMSSIIEVATPGRETETITVSGLTDGYNLASLAQIAEIVINSGDRNSEEEQTETVVQQHPDGTIYQTVDGTSDDVLQDIAVDGTGIGITSEDLAAFSGDMQGSTNLVSLAQIAELVINQGELNPELQQLQIGTDCSSQPVVIPDLETSIRTSSLRTSKSRSMSTTQFLNVPVLKDVKPNLPSTYTTTLMPDGRQTTQKASSGKNIYSKIVSENGECYMVVLPESGSFNPARLQKILTNYSAMKGAEEEPAIKPDPDKPVMFSAGCQTLKRNSKTKYRYYNRKKLDTDSGVAVQRGVGGSVTSTGSGGSVAGRQGMYSSNLDLGDVGTTSHKTVKEICDMMTGLTEMIDVSMKHETPTVDGQSIPGCKRKTNKIANYDNDPSVAKDSDYPGSERVSISVQTDITSDCYVPVDPDSMKRTGLKMVQRCSNRLKRVYLDDSSESESPFLVRKQFLDLENAFYVCGTCNAKYTSADELKVHSRSHKSKPVLCPTCKKRCTNIKVLAEHMVSHTKCKTFKCSVCTTDTVFTSPKAFTTHVKQHLSEKFFICGSCNLQFQHVIQLKVHMRIHTGEKPFPCPECDNSFSQKGSMLSHLSSFHKKEKPFVCNHCKLKFARRTDLRIHERKHTGERPYKCELCEHTYSSNSGLTSHKKTHFRKRFHQCPDSRCNKSFDTPARLKKHVSMWHSFDNASWIKYRRRRLIEDGGDNTMFMSDSLYPCIVCGFSTSKKELLTDHIKEMHPEFVKKMPELFEETSAASNSVTESEKGTESEQATENEQATGIK